MQTCKRTSVRNALLWAAAIISAAIVSAPLAFTLILLPALGFMSLMNLRRKAV